MEPQKVFKEFNSLCTDNAGHLQYFLANNAVLEWFGRTIRGKEKIKNFIRYQLSQEFDHQFNNWETVEAFEDRPSHFETRTILEEATKISSNTQLNCSSNSTPVQNKIKIVELPALNQGRKFLLESDSEEEDLKDLGLAKIIDVTPPSSPVRNTEEPPLKKLKSTKFRNLFLKKNDVAKVIKSNLSAICFDELEYTKSYSEIESSSQPNSNVKLNQTNINRSDLYYIEAVGNLISLNRSKYRGIHSPSTVNGNDVESQSDTNLEVRSTTFNNSYNFPESSCSERGVKLKISYRIRLDNNQIEFALIIYEHSIRKPSIRRNLLQEFKETNTEISDANKSIAVRKLKSEKKNENIKVKRKTPLKRLLRLF